MVWVSLFLWASPDGQAPEYQQMKSRLNILAIVLLPMPEIGSAARGDRNWKWTVGRCVWSRVKPALPLLALVGPGVILNVYYSQVVEKLPAGVRGLVFVTTKKLCYCFFNLLGVEKFDWGFHAPGSGREARQLAACAGFHGTGCLFFLLTALRQEDPMSLALFIILEWIIFSVRLANMCRPSENKMFESIKFAFRYGKPTGHGVDIRTIRIVDSLVESCAGVIQSGSLILLYALGKLYDPNNLITVVCFPYDISVITLGILAFSYGAQLFLGLKFCRSKIVSASPDLEMYLRSKRMNWFFAQSIVAFSPFVAPSVMGALNPKHTTTS